MNAATIPAELRQRPQWVVWRREQRKGKSTKVPYQAASPRDRAKSDDPATWGTFEQAVAAAASAHGIGYMFSADDPYAGVDIDGCVDPTTGELHPAAADVLADLDSWRECSPSGSGIHVIVAAVLPGGKGRETQDTPWAHEDRHEIAVYDRRRFFTITGGEGAIAGRQAQIDRLLTRFFTPNGDRPHDSGVGRSVADLFDAFPKLEQITRRKGKPPRDSTPSGWDYWLCCEAARCGLTDGEIEARTLHCRPGDPKLDRDAYISNTIKNARDAVKDEDAEKADPAKHLTARYNLEKDPVVGGRLIGPGEDAIVRLRRESGKELRLGHLRDLFRGQSNNRVVSVAARTRFGPVTDKEAIELAQQVIALCEYEEADARELAEQWVSDFIARAGAVVDGGDGSGEPRPAWDVLSECEIVKEQLRRDLAGGDPAARAVIVRGHDGRLWIPAGPLRASLSPGAPTWGTLQAALGEIGWTRKLVQAYTPNVKRGEPESRHLETVFYVGPVNG